MGKQLILDVHEKLIVDLFAGGGGMSVAFERAFGRSPDIAINHNEEALSLHRANHPLTRHFIADVYEVCPHGATQGRPVGWLHGSPDCTDHSQASGGQPRRKKIRGLSWVLFRWAGQVSPDVISLENVRQILKWGPLIAKRDPITGRDRLALVTVHIQGTPYVIVDIRLRMLKPRELFNGQDFPADYIIDHGHDGRKFSISSQVRMCGNSVNPVMAEGFLIANAPWMSIRKVA